MILVRHALVHVFVVILWVLHEDLRVNMQHISYQKDKADSIVLNIFLTDICSLSKFTLFSTVDISAWGSLESFGCSPYWPKTQGEKIFKL